MKKLNIQPLALSFAVWSALIMLLLGVLGNFGLYENGIRAMANWHIFFSLTPTGIFLGMVEGAVVSYLGVYLFGLIYNLLNSGRK